MIAIRHIVVGVDGSDNARRALEWAIAIAEPAAARVTAVHAIGLLEELGSERAVGANHREDVERDFRAAWCEPLDRAAIADARVARDGPPADVILDTARACDADLIVVGERASNRGTSRALGSTSRQVLERADRPVLVVPVDERR